MRPRRLLLFLLGTTIVLGLATRRSPAWFSPPLATYGGDAAWAAMVYWGVALVRPAVRARHLALVALGVTFAVEASQLIHTPWLDALRGTRVGALALGRGFLWSDLAAYVAGVAVAVVLDVACGVVRRSRAVPH